MLAGRLELLQTYASWLADPRASALTYADILAPILARLPDTLPDVGGGEVFIDARQEDALLALSSLSSRTVDTWPILYKYVQRFARWRTLHNQEDLLYSLLKGLLGRVPEDSLDDAHALISTNMENMADDKAALVLIATVFKVLNECSCDPKLKQMLTTSAVENIIKNSAQLTANPKTWPVYSSIVRSLDAGAQSEQSYHILLKMAEAICLIVRVKTDPPAPLVELFVSAVTTCRLISSTNNIVDDSSYLQSLVLEFKCFASMAVFGQVVAPVIDLIAVSFSASASLQLLNRLRPIIDDLAKMNLTEIPEYEQLAHLYGLLMGRLILNCLDSNERSSVLGFIKGLQANIPESPKPSETITGGFHSACPTALPIFGAVCQVVRDGDLAEHCFSIVAKCFAKGPFGQRARIFYDQMIAIAASAAGVLQVNSTLDILCRTYLDMEGLDANSAALATAFEDLVNSCSASQVKLELVTLSLLGLFVQKGVKLAADRQQNPGSNIPVLRQPPAALLELLLPAVAMGLTQLVKVDSISRQAYVELVQEFWFVAIFHTFQPSLRWPDSWLRPLSKVAIHSPVLIKERDRAEGNTAKVLLSQPLSADLKSHLAGLMTNAADRVAHELGTAQCLWLLAFHQSESMRIIGTDKFESLVQYLTDDIVAELSLSDFVNDLSIGIVKGWLEKTGRSNPTLMITLAVSVVDLLGSIYDRIHDAGIALLRFILTQDEQLMAEEAIWQTLFSRLRLLSALKCHEPGSTDPSDFAQLTPKDHITDSAYARRVFEDVLAFFRSVCTAAARLSPDTWREWVIEKVRELNNPNSGADLDFLLDDLLRSLLLDRQQPKRAAEGPSLDGSRQLAHHLDWCLEKCGLSVEQLVQELQDTDALRTAILAAFGDLKECRLLTNCWSSVIKRHSSQLHPIIAELGSLLNVHYTQQRDKATNVFMSKVTMGPSAETFFDPLPVRPLCLVNIISFLTIQLGRQTFSAPGSVALFSLIGQVLLDVGRCWPGGHGRRLVVYAVCDYAVKVLLQLQQRTSPGSPQTAQFRTQLFLFLQNYYEQPVDWHIESRRVLQLECDHVRSVLGSLKKVSGSKRHGQVCELFEGLLRNDLLRLGALLNRKPSEEAAKDWKRLVQTACSISVPLAIQLDDRMGGKQDVGLLKGELNRALVRNPWSVYTDHTPAVIEAVLHCTLDPGDSMIGRAIFPPGLLHFLPPCPPLTALAIFRSSIHDQSPRWLNYAMRSLESFPPDLLFFYTPQITQAVRRDHLGYIETTILHIARTSSKLAHQIIWNMQANMYIDDLGTVPDPMKAKLEELVGKIVNGLSDIAFYRREFAFFERVTGISGKLKAFIKREKWEKKKKIDEELRQIPVDAGVYLPSNPESTVIDIDYDSGRPLQSQAKAPFMATFRVHDAALNKEVWQSAIFKVGDDCRQDVLALQFIAAIKMILSASGLNGYLFPYRVVATAPGCGVIEVIPASQSRDQLGREKINSLFGYFIFKFGGERTERFGAARSALVHSMAAYSVVCYLLAIRDRHNGNIMVSDHGHIIHIDFGFILDIAPGGIRFESAPFKFTSEMLQVLGSRDSSSFAHFQELCVQCFLAVRPYCGLLVKLVEQMCEAGLPCFTGNPEKAIRNLRTRFKTELDEWEARAHMEGLVYQSCENTSTVLYDSYQHNRNGIPY